MPTKKVSNTNSETKVAKKSTVKKAIDKPVKKVEPEKSQIEKVEVKKEVKVEKKVVKARKKDTEIKVAAKNHYGTGRRKTAVARVWIFEGKGNIEVNNLSLMDYFKNVLLVDLVKYPLISLGLSERYDVVIKVQGGGLVGQAGAVRLGLARAILASNAELKDKLKSEELLTRDSRVKERKKYGRKKARKGFQFRKR